MIDKLKAFFKVEPQEEGKKESFADRIKQLRDKCLDLIKKLFLLHGLSAFSQ